MSKILTTSFERTLDQLVAGAVAGQSFEAWTFDDRNSRSAAERRLAEKGITARIRSAYKPVLYTFLEEVDLRGVEAIEIRYPVHPDAPRNWFRLEAYPLAALVGDAKIDFVEREDGEFFYDVRLTKTTGVKTLKVLAPNRVHVDIVGETNVSPTGWYRAAGDDQGERLETDYEALFAASIAAVAEQDWGSEEPYFEELNIRVAHPAEDEPLAVGDEVVSLREALHEDFYFSLLEFFQKKSGRPLGDRGLKPGQIVPEIVKSQGEVSVAIEVRPLSTLFLDGEVQDLETAREPLAVAQVARLLGEVDGAAFAGGELAGGKHVVHFSYAAPKRETKVNIKINARTP